MLGRIDAPLASRRMTAALPPGYHERMPPAGLASWVECLWWHRSDGAVEADRGAILPDGRIDLVWTASAGTLVAGPQRRHMARPFPSPFVAIGARFVPGAGATVLGVPASELLDGHFPLDGVDGRLASALDARLSHARGPAQALAALASILRDRCLGLDEPDPLVRAVVAKLAGGNMPVSALADGVAVSERQLQRRFRAHVGYGPKTLDRVLRFRRLVSALAGDRHGDDGLAGCALAAGYCDQAHLTRESRELSGLTPTQLRGRLAA